MKTIVTSIRIEPELLNEVKDAAKKNGRNQFIIEAIKEKLENDTRGKGKRTC